MRDSDYMIAVSRTMTDLGKTPVEVVGDYLKLLWNHIMDHIMTQITNETGESLFYGTTVHVDIVITVPSIWTNDTNEGMIQAALYAGLYDYSLTGRTTITFVSEPEAAALATLSDVEDCKDLGVDDTFVVVDVGGGTVYGLLNHAVCTIMLTGRLSVTSSATESID